MTRRSFWQALGLTTFVFGAIWLVMILRWRSENRMPNGVDIAVYLVGLPLLLLLSYVGVRFFIDRFKRTGASKKNAATDTQAAVEAEPKDDPSLRWSLPILAGEVLFAAGDTPDALSAAAVVGQRPEFHPTFRDSRGLPVFAAEVSDLDMEALESESDQLHGFSAMRLRTLLLADTVMAKLLEQHGQLLEKPATDSSTSDAPAAKSSVAISLEWLLPASWSDADRDLAASWLTTRLSQQGWGSDKLRIQCRAINGGAQALARLDEINRHFHNGTVGCQLLMASDSFIDEAEIQAWDSSGRLHKAERAEGRIPGEGACALLLGRAPNPDESRPAQLHRVMLAQRAQSADKPGRLRIDTLQNLLQQSLEPCGEKITAEKLVYGIADTDVRPSRMAESLQLLDHALTEQDPTATLQPLAIANADAGAAIALALVAVAAALTRDQQQPGLIFSVHDGLARALALVSPEPLDGNTVEPKTQSKTPSASPSLV